MIVTVWLEVTGVVVTEKLAVDAFAAIVTVKGTLAAFPLLLRLITAPPVGAGAESLTVPVTPVPPVTEVELNVND